MPIVILTENYFNILFQDWNALEDNKNDNIFYSRRPSGVLSWNIKIILINSRYMCYITVFRLCMPITISEKRQGWREYGKSTVDLELLRSADNQSAFQSWANAVRSTMCISESGQCCTEYYDGYFHKEVGLVVGLLEPPNWPLFRHVSHRGRRKSLPYKTIIMLRVISLQLC